MPKPSIAAALVLAGLLAPGAVAATLTPTRVDDLAPDGCTPTDCSLREAVLLANALGGPDTVVLGPGVYQLTRPGSGEDGGLTGDLDISGPLTIQGAGQGTTTIVGVALGDRLLEAFAPLTLFDLRLEGGQAPSNAAGGALLTGAATTLRRVSVANNGALAGGGVFAWSAAYTLDLDSCAFEGNWAESGGALGAEGGLTVTIAQTAFTGNTATNTGGALRLVAYPGTTLRLSVRDSHFSHNIAGFGGAVGLVADSTLQGSWPELMADLVRTEFLANHAPNGYGGALGTLPYGLDAVALRVALRDSLFQDNDAYRGGAVLVGVGLADVTSSRFLGNDATAAGGAVWAGAMGGQVGSARVSGSRFATNTAATDGGAVWAEGGLEIHRSSFVDNQAGGVGGAVWAGGGTLVTRSTFSGNVAQTGGGLWAGDAFVQVFQSTFRAPAQAGAVLYGGAATWGNQLRYAGNVISGTCSGASALTFGSDGGNLESPGASCFPFGAGPGDLSGVSEAQLALGPLETDGRTSFHVPGAGSAARDRAAAACADLDQRGYLAADSACDTGAIEAGALNDVLFRDGFEWTRTGLWGGHAGGVPPPVDDLRLRAPAPAQ
jgi:adhesin HecA-like repeat protein